MLNPMEISRLLKAVILNTKARDHASVLDGMTQRLLPEGRAPGTGAICDLKAHESTEGILSGTGAAIFHCLSEEVKDTAIALSVSTRPLPHPLRKTRVRIFFLIISPIKESGSHLQLLSKLEGLVLDPAFRHAVLLASSDEEALRAVKRAEASARSMYMPLPRDEVFSELGSSPSGLTEADARARLKLTGPNSIKRVAKSTLLKDFLHNIFLNLFAVLLWAGGFMSFVAGMPELGWAIFLVIVINATFSFWQEYKAERAVEALKNLLPKKVRLVRDGQEREIDAASLVPGDLIRLSEGNSVPADGRLVVSEAMRVDNSTLTGEARPIYKVSEPLEDGKGFIWTEVPNMVFAGTTVLSGGGSMIVTATGMDTEIGRVAYLTQAIKAEMSPLQKEIVSITKVVTGIALFLGVSFFLLGIGLAGLTYAESFIFAIGIIVANVPEGLLPTVSLSLAMGVQRMAGKKAIVKKLSAVETLGSATVICTDKTGTLTQNRMCATRVFVNGRMIEVTGTGYAPEGGFFIEKERMTLDGLKKEGALDLLAIMALCNNAKLHPPAKGGDWTVSGDPTEGALLTIAAKAGLDIESLEKSYKRAAHLPFERIRKRMTTIHEAKGGLRAFVKGSPKEVLALCARIHSGGKVVPLSDEERALILRENDSMARSGLRTLAAAYREAERKDKYAPAEVEQDLVFAGLVAMLDPPRPEVKEAVADCHTAGIKVVMVTGDYGLTARSIAEEVGIDKDARLITGT
ncbi:MAG: HAD-IC family P-type ATPase, partial [Deltaproteobacteria bacterium]|nr:HAD-IC family P-type ATPase [Deltaproteobacteria bacterium]